MTIVKYDVEIAGRTIEVKLEQQNGKILAEIDGRTYQAEVISPQPQTYLMLVNNHVYDFFVDTGAEPGEMLVQTSKDRLQARIIDRKRLAGKSEVAISGVQSIRAPMPGRVVQILKAVGDEVKAGEGVLVVEAMKMQNELTSPKMGIVTELKISVGQTVSANDVLAVIE